MCVCMETAVSASCVQQSWVLLSSGRRRWQRYILSWYECQLRVGVVMASPDRWWRGLPLSRRYDFPVTFTFQPCPSFLFRDYTHGAAKGQASLLFISLLFINLIVTKQPYLNLTRFMECSFPFFPRLLNIQCLKVGDSLLTFFPPY